MKKRLLMLLSLFMAITSVGWVQGQSVTVDNVADLRKAITEGKSPIALSPGTYALSEQLVIKKRINIQGTGSASAVIITTDDAVWPGENVLKNLISIEVSTDGPSDATKIVRITNLTIQNSKAAGINAQTDMKVMLENVTLKDNATAGLLVHSEVDANGVRTSGNKWGGVNVNIGTPEYVPSFTFDVHSSFSEKAQIWSEITDDANIVAAPAEAGWRNYIGKGGVEDKTSMRFWTNAPASTEVSVADAESLIDAIKQAAAGQTIVLTGETYGTEGTPQSFGEVKVSNVTIKAKDATKKPKLYGTIQLMADGCTVEGLEFHTKGGSHPLKNAIDVVAMSVTIRNNKFIMTKPTDGSVGNGVTIWPVGAAATAAYTISGNEFDGFTGIADIWNSTALQIADACSLNEHFADRHDVSKVVVLPNEKNYWIDNKFTNCDADYVHATWPNNKALYSFVAISTSANNVAVLTEAIASAVKGAQVFIAGDFKLTSQLKITAPITLNGTGADKTSFTAANETKLNLISVERTKNVSFGNLTIKGAKKNGLHVYMSDNVTLTNVTLSGNTASGLLVNGSTVMANKLTTDGNAWGGIEVAKGVDVDKDPKLTLTDCSIKDPKASIWADTDPSKEAKVAEWIAGAGWNMFVTKKGGEGSDKDNLQTFWTLKKKIQINVAKSSFIYESGKRQTLAYTITPADIKDVTVKYHDISQTKDETADGKEAVGSYYVLFTRAADDSYLALNDTVTMTISKKGVPEVADNLPTPTTVEAGQPLSMSILQGGKAAIGGKDVMGSFAWSDANTIAEEGKHKYAVTFTPANIAEIETVVDSIEINAIRYFTVTTGVSANGKAIIAAMDKSTSDRYAKNKGLNFTITPDQGYEFTGWNGTEKKDLSYSVGKDTTFVAGFTIKKFVVTVTPTTEGNTLTVKYKDAKGAEQTISGTATLPYGTMLAVTASSTSQNVKAISSTGSVLSKGQIILDAATTITAEFEAKPQTPKVVTVTTPVGGTIRLTNKADGKEVVPGSAVAENTTLIIERTPNKGYKLTDATQARTEITVTGDVSIPSSFTKEVYAITKVNVAGCTLTVSQASGNYGDEVTASYEATAGYKVVALMVNAKEVPNGSTFILTENTTVQAIVKEKAAISINALEQSYVYNGYNQSFVVKSTPAGLDSMVVSYTAQNGQTVSTPINAGTYTVHINRNEDANYKQLAATATLKIMQAPIVITARPATADADGAASVAGTWAAGEKIADGYVPPMTKAASTNSFAVFTPASSNYAPGYCAPGSTLDMKVTSSVSAGVGSVSVWDGNLQITGTDNNALKSQELRAIATPAEGYKFSKWTSGITTDEDKTKASVTITPSTDIAFVAEFIAKATLIPSLSDNSVVYDGTAKGTGLKITSGAITTGWSYTFQQNGMTVVPVNAGTYDVVISREADADNKAFYGKIAAAFIIKKATPVVTTAPVASVVKGALLYSATVAGGAASTDGKFVWKDVDGSVGGETTKTMTFVPSDLDNFDKADQIVTVKTTDLQVVSFMQPEHATLVVKRGETVLASGDPIANGDVLTITVTPNDGYELKTLKVGGATFVNGKTYTVTGNATISIEATVGAISGGGDNPGTSDVAATGVSLDVTTKTLLRTETFTLTATVTPTGATNKGVKWSSSNPAIASVDANGKVTAIKVGEATITVTTDDGAFTASCVVTVDFATSLEEAIAATRVYALNGSICIEPQMPMDVAVVNMVGQVIYNGHITGASQIAVSTSGIYIVKLGAGNDAKVHKISVK